MKRTIVWMAALVMILASAAGAAGQEITLGIKFGLAVDDSNYGGLPFELKDDLGLTYGLRLEVRKDHFGVEVGYLHTDRSLLPTPEAPPDLEETTFRLNTLSCNALYYPFLTATLLPYLTGGYSYYRVHIVGYDEDRSGGFNLGAGLNLLLLPHVSISLEARYHWVSFAFADEPFDARTWAANLGLNYHF